MVTARPWTARGCGFWRGGPRTKPCSRTSLAGFRSSIDWRRAPARSSALPTVGSASSSSVASCARFSSVPARSDRVAIARRRASVCRAPPRITAFIDVHLWIGEAPWCEVAPVGGANDGPDLGRRLSAIARRCRHACRTLATCFSEKHTTAPADICRPLQQPPRAGSHVTPDVMSPKLTRGRRISDANNI
jgi:hypothetical protein